MWEESSLLPHYAHSSLPAFNTQGSEGPYEGTIDRLSDGLTGNKKVVTFRNILCIDPAKDLTLKISLLQGTFSSHIYYYKGDRS